MTTAPPCSDWRPLGFGLNYERPAVEHLWGARAIFRPGGGNSAPLEFVRGRSSHHGDTDVVKSICKRVNDRIDELQQTASDKYATRELDPASQSPENVVLIDDEDLRVIANTNGSHGYIYLAAWRPGDEL